MLKENSKDFSLFVDWNPTGWNEEENKDTQVTTPDTTTPASTEAAVATDPAATDTTTATEDQAAVDAATWTDSAAATEPAAGWEGNPDGTESGPAEPWDDEFSAMIAALNDESWDNVEKAEVIKEDVAAIQANPELPESVKNQMSDLNTKVTELTLELTRKDAAIEILNREYQKVVSQSAEQEYASGNWSKVLAAIDKSPTIKGFIAAQVDYDREQNDTNKAKLIQRAKSVYEELSWVTLDEMQPDASTGMSTTNDMSTDAAWSETSTLFV